MEIRALEYFLAVAREQNITRAAEYLHLTQPTLSRRIADLEAEFGKQLFIRGKRKVTLTEDGVLLRKRAEEIVALAERTVVEMKNADTALSGNIYIGSGESMSIKNIIRVAKKLQEQFPHVHFHMISGDTADLKERLDKGLFDFCILYGDIDRSKYEYLPLPYKEVWGILMRTDAPFASQTQITVKDLTQMPLIVSRQMSEYKGFMKKLTKEAVELNITNTYNLINNAALMAAEDMGYVLTLQDLVNTNGTELCFRPIFPEQTLELSLVWKRYQPLSKAAEQFVTMVEESLECN